MTEQYENILFKVDDDLMASLETNFKKNVIQLKRSRNKFVSVISPLSCYDFVSFIHWFLEKNGELENAPKEMIIDDKWLNSRFAHFAVHPDIVEEYSGSVVVRADFDFDERH